MFDFILRANSARMLSCLQRCHISRSSETTNIQLAGAVLDTIADHEPVEDGAKAFANNLD
jgi:hypothetical protein